MVEVEDRPTCFYYTKCGHIISNCFVINKKRKNCPEAVTLLKREASNRGAPHTINPVFSPLIMKGSVPLTDERPEVPVAILRDSGGLAVTHVRRSVAFIRSSLNSDFLLWWCFCGFGCNLLGCRYTNFSLVLSWLSGLSR